MSVGRVNSWSHAVIRDGGGAWSSRFERTLNATWVDVAIVEQKLADICKCYRKNNPLVQHFCCLNYFLRSFFYVIMLMMITKLILFQ